MNLPFSAAPPPSRDRTSGVTLVLGPTNTGKTHYAIERMLAHRSGMIGLPLRLLAREVYNRVVEKVGVEAVALVTGEEKIKPSRARYWICTVEAMPRDLDLAFVAVDEIQLAADMDRGHVFTDRLLNRRGLDETLLIGAQTMERPLMDLLPGAKVMTRPRMSKLTFAGERKIARLPPRCAVVAFSAEEVYAIAEWIRRQRGGAAVVLGALSPRTRNAQVDLYQSGDVDYIVATDAIGMGLNLDVDHIAFAGDRKFDGWHYRRLHPSEFGQIAGRAGRHLRDGTFGTTGRCPPFDNDLVEMLETHRFDPVRMLQWRNTDLDMTSTEALSASLDVLPGEAGLTRAPLAADQIALDIASRDPEVRKVACNRGDVARLWECCQIPDYRKLSPAAHAELVLTVYGFVVRAGRIPDTWFARQIDTLDRVEGDIDALSNRIAQVRTWTFIANRPDWLRDPEHWQGVTRRVEDTLSDALHERLAQRFVDRRTSVLRRRLRENAIMEAEITSSGDVVVEGQHVGQLNGFRFTSDPQAAGEEAKTLNAAAQKALASEIEGRATRVSEAVDEAFVLANDGLIRWLGEPVGRIVVGPHILQPHVRVIADEHLTGPALELVQRRLDLWLLQHVKKLLGPLADMEAGEGLEGMAKGIAFQIAEALGVLERAKVADEVKALPQDARGSLRKLGVRFGAYHLYLPALVKPAPRALAAQLWALKNGGVEGVKGLDEVPHLASSGRTSFVADQAVPKGFYRAAGFRVCGERAVRVDILERLADLIRPAIAYRPGTTPGDPPPGAADGDGFVVTVGMTSLAGCSGEAFGSILKSLGYVLDRRVGPAITIPLVPKAATEPVRVAPGPDDVRDAAIAAEAAPSPAADPHPEETGAVDPDLESRVSLARQSELIAAALEGGALDAIEPLPATTEPAAPVSTAMEAPAQSEPMSSDLIPVAEIASDLAADDSTKATGVDAPAPAAPEEVPLIEVWRPHRHNVHNNRRPADRNRGARRPLRADMSTPVATPTDSVPAEPGQRPPRSDAPRGRFRDFKRANEGAPAGREGGGRPPNRDRRDQGGQRSRDEYRPGVVSDKPKPREKQPDPDSPFAKLAALKAQLEKDKK
jgi:ATP-dependent RNA helicase SUPV3L1/SUV3